MDARRHGSRHVASTFVDGVRLACSTGHNVNPRSLANFPVQANGAEMLRLAACLATEQGINVCAPIHDALLVESADCDIAEVVTQTAGAMAEAGRIVLDGFELRTDAEVVSWPDRYMDARGAVLWEEITKLAATATCQKPD
jgi:DNA polymerase-1